MATRVHLADDHTIFRQDLEAILSAREGVEVLGSSTGQNAAARVAKTRPGMIVTEPDMQPREAEELLATIGAVSLAPGAGNAVISIPRGLLQRLDDGPRADSARGRPRCWSSPPAAFPTAGSARSCTSPR